MIHRLHTTWSKLQLRCAQQYEVHFDIAAVPGVEKTCLVLAVELNTCGYSVEVK